jgi:hypothetical protein
MAELSALQGFLRPGICAGSALLHEKLENSGGMAFVGAF